MKKDSIFFSITITFVISFIFIIASFLVLNHSFENRERHFVSKMNFEAVKTVLREYRYHGITQNVKDELESRGFSIILDSKEQEKILNDKDFKKLHSFEGKGARLTDFKLGRNYYMYIQSRRIDFILKNNNEIKNHKALVFGIFIVVLLSFIALYVTTIKKLRPLKTLQEKVKNFGNEEFDIDCSSEKKDEISLLANEFDASAKKLKKLKESRNIFIRNIMHELKTPITKGMFLTQLPKTEENSEMMQKVFYRLESLITELATIEELISTKKVLEKKEYFLADIIDNSIDILMCNEDEVIKDFKNLKLHVDFNLFCIAVKNMLDNGIKYSVDKKVTVRTKENSIVFQNKGEKLKYPLEDYFEPFFKGDDVKSNQSFGLGLYIVKHILDANTCSLKYNYEDGLNSFIILLDEV